MKKIYIFGMGKGKAYIDRCLMLQNVNVIGIIDNYKADKGELCKGIPVIKQDQINGEFDFIIISLMKYKDAKDNLCNQGIGENKIISFFDENDAECEQFSEVLDPFKWKTELMWKHYRETVAPTIDNLAYEIYADSEIVQKHCPQIKNVSITAEILAKEKKCMARFGDGEFELIMGRPRANFQNVDCELGKRLREALESNDERLLIAIADNYGKLDKYTDEAARDIRSYLTKEVRKNHMELLDLKRTYYDAYISRPYIMYRDKEGAKKRFDDVKKIWDKKDVLIVEGEFTRFGVGNDLLDNASSIERIIAPSKNAFSKYEQIVEEARKYGKDKLILTILGPTATIMAYALSREGYWIIDIGQLDVEYEWYLRGVTERCNIPYKCVSEVAQYDEIVTETDKTYIQKYQNEIVAKII